MTLINRAAWRRIKARLDPKPIIEGKLYAADIKSVSIGGREFPGLTEVERRYDRFSVDKVFKITGGAGKIDP